MSVLCESKHYSPAAGFIFRICLIDTVGNSIYLSFYIIQNFTSLFKMPRKPASENVVCSCRLLNMLANFLDILFAYRQTVWTLIRLLLEEKSDLNPHCLQK